MGRIGGAELVFSSWEAVRTGWQRCVVEGQWIAGMRWLVLAPVFTADMKVAYLMGLFGGDGVGVWCCMKGLRTRLGIERH